MANPTTPAPEREEAKKSTVRPLEWLTDEKGLPIPGTHNDRDYPPAPSGETTSEREEPSLYIRLDTVYPPVSSPEPSDAGMYDDDETHEERDHRMAIAYVRIAADTKEKYVTMATEPLRVVLADAGRLAQMADDMKAEIARLSRERDERQRAILAWTEETFGAFSTNQMERADRFIEEAIELAQACGIDALDVHRFVEKVYTRKPGEAAKEIGQVGLTLLALAERLGISAEERERAEFDRVRAIPATEWKRRHDAKLNDGRARMSPPTGEQQHG